jgi:hypothetical protein
MPATPRFGLRYPAGTDPADVPTRLQQLASDVEGRLSALSDASNERTVSCGVYVVNAAGLVRRVSILAGREVFTYQKIGYRVTGDISIRFGADAPQAGRVIITMPAAGLMPVEGGTVANVGTFRANLQQAAPSTAVYRAFGHVAVSDLNPTTLDAAAFILQAPSGGNQVVPIGDANDLTAGMRLGTDTVVNINLTYRAQTA